MAKDKEKNKDEKPEGGKSKKKLLIMAGGGGGLVIILGIVLAIVFMGGDDESTDTAGAAPHDPTMTEEIEGDQADGDEGHAPPEEEAGGHGAPEAAEGEGGGHAEAPAANISGATSYVFENAFVVNVHDDTGRRYLNMIMEIETAGPEVVSDIKQNVAPLRDAIIMLLSSKTVEELGQVEGKLKLKQEIIFRLESVLEPGSIEAIYFTEFSTIVL